MFPSSGKTRSRSRLIRRISSGRWTSLCPPFLQSAGSLHVHAAFDDSHGSVGALFVPSRITPYLVSRVVLVLSRLLRRLRRFDEQENSNIVTMCGDPPLAKAPKREGEPRERAAPRSGTARPAAAPLKVEHVSAGGKPGGGGAAGAFTLSSRLLHVESTRISFCFFPAKACFVHSWS